MNKKRVVWTLAAVLYVAFIFHNSMTPAVESSRQSGAVVRAVVAALGNLGLEGGWVTEHLVRKTAHFVEYAVLGVILWNCLRAYRMENQRWLLWQLWLGTVIPLMDETIQLFTEGRSGQISDVWLDMSGVLAGGCVMILCYVAVKRKSGGDSEMA